MAMVSKKSSKRWLEFYLVARRVWSEPAAGVVAMVVL